MKRSYFLSRRLPYRVRSRTRRLGTRRLGTRRLGTRKTRQRKTRMRKTRMRKTRRLKGGAIGETVATVEGIPVGRNTVVTNSKGVTRSLKDYQMMNTETAGAKGDDDI